MHVLRRIAAWIGCVALLAGCGMSSLNDVKPIAKKYRLPLKEDVQEGTWTSKDIQVGYRYRIGAPGTLELSGDLALDNYLITGFTAIDRLTLSVLFLDAEGRILGQKAIYLVAGRQPVDQLMRFDRILALPEGAKAFSFSYSGEVSASGDNDGRSNWNFWF
uniref:Lipoprotein n=1 Tax=Desulfatirhabdium butyrativorans TaxID=340467 RepID=A0A7C4MS26_9BACT